ncbi:Sugar kinase of the NBD/HSP70 family, may contain an N-terminal HTH domain [Amycolatopsis lurida]|uniref:Transcriptional regulator, ROK family protein n=1 Tax=Amycolatopsis lurida NRRL 2430 TaxID=1460371 RepID=A0A2P2FZ80_AMYLU|nr:ROK family transcriptional regulator [Amycolatopsis lurida]KFU82019.1 transcriptional regulator, ROK family protein [Amycolatopsis lurida NRRL 2430]SEC42098.1 Sugar kinase of the NBD/HSP70 family, may contain an N-terminal HTH domain [Amycolatopsis lurida]
MNQPRLSGTQPRRARQANTAAVLQLLVQRGPLARSDIAKELSLNHGSVSRIIEPLLSAGIVRELDGWSTRLGRPRVPVELDPSSRYAVGVHLGLERTTVGLTDLAGHSVRTHAENRDPADSSATLRRAAELAAGMAGSAPGPVMGIGVTVGGEVDRAGGRVVRNDVLGWTDVRIAGPLRDWTGLEVVVDANVCALLGAELTFGGGLSRHSALYLFIGNVAETGFLGRPEAGPDGVVQGTFGRILVPCLAGRGHARFDECGTDVALLAAARSAGLTASSPADLIRLADTDPVAIGLLEARSTQVALLADTMYDLMRPHTIILGGSGASSGRWLEAVRDKVETTPPQSLILPRSGDDPLVVAAAGLVVRAFFAAGTTR